MPYEEWKVYLSTFKNETENVLFPLQSYFKGPTFPSHSDDSHFQKSNLEALKLDEFPEITSKILSLWVKKKKIIYFF